MTNMLTGYGPRTGPLFDGDERKFELWEIKFLGYLRLKKLDTIFTPLAEYANEEPGRRMQRRISMHLQNSSSV